MIMEKIIYADDQINEYENDDNNDQIIQENNTENNEQFSDEFSDEEDENNDENDDENEFFDNYFDYFDQNNKWTLRKYSSNFLYYFSFYFKEKFYYIIFPIIEKYLLPLPQIIFNYLNNNNNNIIIINNNNLNNNLINNNNNNNENNNLIFRVKFEELKIILKRKEGATMGLAILFSSISSLKINFFQYLNENLTEEFSQFQYNFIQQLNLSNDDQNNRLILFHLFVGFLF